MFRLVALVSLRWPRQVVLLGVILILAGLPFGVTVQRNLLAGGFQAPAHDSTIADELLEKDFPNGPPNVILHVSADPRGVDDATVMRDGGALTRRLAGEGGVDSVVSYWTTQDPRLRSRDGRSALIVARVRGNENDIRTRTAALYPRYAGRQGELTVRFGGQPAVQRELADELRHDLVVAELLSAPLLLIALLFVFRGIVAALLPLALGAFSVVSTLIVLGLLVRITKVSVFSLNMASALGLGLAIDYSLFILTRYREETTAGRAAPDAVLRAVRTAGHTVLFSGLTLATCLSATLVFPLYYLRSFAYAGITVVLLSVLSALFLLPALLILLGARVETRRTSDPADTGRAIPPRTPGDRFWFGAARMVLRHRILSALAGTAILLVLALPFTHARFALPDDRILPTASEAHQVTRAVSEQFPDCVPCGIPVVAVHGTAAGGDDSQVAGYAAQVSTVAGVDRVDSAEGSYRQGGLLSPPTASASRFRGSGGAQWLLVQPAATEPYSTGALAMVDDIRAVPAPSEVHVGGLSAHARDTQRTLMDRIPLAVGWIVLAMFVLLVLFAGSVLIPVKAIVLSTLSLTASFGAMVFVFQQGHLRWLVGDFQVSGLLEETTLVLMFFVAFGMSMDYELFLLSRIKESYDRYGDNARAVMIGLGQTGRLVTSAAVCMVLVLLAFATSHVTALKMLGIGLALAIISDATVVRGVLVPALMGLLGRANWWLPGRPRPSRTLAGGRGDVRGAASETRLK